MACRSSERANEAIETLKKETNKDAITFLPLDTSNLDSVRKYVTAFLEKFDRLDILINNAGMLAKFGETTQSKEVSIFKCLRGRMSSSLFSFISR